MSQRLRAEVNFETIAGDSYVVTEDDTLIEIAQSCNTSGAAMLNANPDIEDRSLILEGQGWVAVAALNDVETISEPFESIGGRHRHRRGAGDDQPFR